MFVAILESRATIRRHATTCCHLQCCEEKPPTVFWRKACPWRVPTTSCSMLVSGSWKKIFSKFNYQQIGQDPKCKSQFLLKTSALVFFKMWLTKHRLLLTCVKGYHRLTLLSKLEYSSSVFSLNLLKNIHLNFYNRYKPQNFRQTNYFFS